MALASLNFSSLATSLPNRIGLCCSSFNASRVSFSPSNTRVCTFRPVKALMMARREQELVQFRNMSDEEINENVVDLKGELIVLRMKQVARQEMKNSEFCKMRKQIARMLTVRRERELEKGIKKRESRKLDRAWKRSIVVKPPKSLTALMAKKTEK